MADISEKLTRKQEQAMVALLANRTVEDAGRACHTPARTLYRWLKDPDFNAAYRATKRTAYEQGIARLHHVNSAAVSTLGKVMLDPATPPAAKIRAADSILNHTLKAIENEEIEARLPVLQRTWVLVTPDGKRSGGSLGPARLDGLQFDGVSRVEAHRGSEKPSSRLEA